MTVVGVGGFQETLDLTNRQIHSDPVSGGAEYGSVDTLSQQLARDGIDGFIRGSDKVTDLLCRKVLAVAWMRWIRDFHGDLGEGVGVFLSQSNLKVDDLRVGRRRDPRPA